MAVVVGEDSGRLLVVEDRHCARTVKFTPGEEKRERNCAATKHI